MQSSKIDRIKDLVEQLNAASESYYAKDQEIMSNYEYDKLYDELGELEEETGYCSDDLTRILSLKTTVAFCDEFIDVYLAKNLKPGHQHLDEGEFIDVAAYGVDELCDMIYAGTIQDAKTVAGILAYKNLLNQD